MANDKVADFLTRVRNAQKAQLASLTCPASNLLVDICKVLKEEGVEIVGEIQAESYGKFGWIMDPEGNKIELWEPIDDGF